MEAKELRVGNMVIATTEHNGKPVRIMNCIVDSIDRETICFNFTRRTDLKNVEPIPLTEDWLVKLGLTKSPLRIDGGPVELWWLFDGYRFLYEGQQKYFNGPLGIQVKYVHQLQNLYFALTGEELRA